MARPKKGEEHPRPEYEKRIKTMVAVGISQNDIARVLRMGLGTLHEHYKDALEVGATEANEVVGGKIFMAAKGGEQWACALWAARRMGWKETQQVEQSVRVISDEPMSEIEWQNRFAPKHAQS